MMREKDKRLSEQCEKLVDVASGALQWIADNEELVGDKKDELVKQLKKQSTEARKISRASERPMSVGIFGPSQHGKSFMMQGFITETKGDDKSSIEREGRVRFGNEGEYQFLDFLNEVNPQGGRETTGLVTRFTLQDTQSPANSPVCLRVFREIDVVKILANSFVLDLDKDAVNPLDMAYVSKVLNELEADAQAENIDQLRAEDIYELQDYFEHSLSRHPLVERELGEWFWDRVDNLIPKLSPNKRMAAFSLLWGEVPQFNQIYIELKDALDKLGHSEWVFAPLDAITNNTPGKTILHVLTVKESLGNPGEGELTQLCTLDGKTATLRKPLVTALAFEMIARLEKGVFDFLESTDLLDFPGARSRKGASREKFFADSGEEHPVGEAFVRGKVAVMFDNYSANYDLNTMIAVHKASQLEVPNYPDLVEDWVKRTHGSTAESRVGKSVNLLFAVTMCDRFFEVSQGQKDKALKISNLLNVVDEFSPSVNEWTPAQPFNNSYLIRNPAGCRLDNLFSISDIGHGGAWIELGIKPESLTLAQEYKDAFLGTDIAQKYFKDVASAWDEMIKPDDGGITYLANGLAEACTTDVKFDQIQPKADSLIKNLTQNLKPFFEDGDIEERIKQRIGAIKEVITRLETHPDLIPSFIGEYQVTQEKIRAIYLDYRRNKQLGVAKSRYAYYESAGQMIVSSWVSSMAKKCNNEHLCEFYSLEPDHMRSVANELQAGTQLVELVDAINEKLEKIEAYVSSATKIADHAATMVATLINDFVNHLGCKGELKAPAVDYPNDLFRPLIRIDETKGIPVLHERTKDMAEARNEFSRSWLAALVFVTEVNASSSKGTLVNVEENAKLGSILATLGDIA